MSLTDGDLDLRPPSKSSFTVGEYMFADVENLEHYAKYLNQSLITFGFPASLDLFTNDPVRIELILLCLSFTPKWRSRLEGQLQVKDREILTITRTVAKNSQTLKAQNEKLQ
ncbi:hypothetical protein GmHk_09G026022 [Glycine max]|nr:hypothetical protein GmHk_09G026022 [Glycine max]